jgi:hypothetical protein
VEAAWERVVQRGRSSPAGPKSKESFITDLVFLNFNGFRILARIWIFVQGDLGGILMWGFFLNSSRLLMDFRKIEYVIPCNASYARLFLECLSYARQIDMQRICTSILVKFYSWKMWVLQTYPL